MSFLRAQSSDTAIEYLDLLPQVELMGAACIPVPTTSYYRVREIIL